MVLPYIVSTKIKMKKINKPTLSQKFLGKQSKYPKLYAFHFYSFLTIIGSFLFGWLINMYLMLVGFVLIPFFVISGGIVSYLDKIVLVGPLKMGRIEGTPAKVIGVFEIILGALGLLMLLTAVFFLSLFSSFG